MGLSDRLCLGIKEEKELAMIPSLLMNSVETALSRKLGCQKACAPHKVVLQSKQKVGV